MEKIEELCKDIECCKKCELSKGRLETVPGEGDINADIMIIGESPGKNEDEQGRPFVGRAGGLLETILRKELDCERKDVYICNIVKCRPPNNRDPLPSEIEQCIPYLQKQIDIIKPKVIILLGAVALRSLFGDSKLTIGRCRGEWMEYQKIPVMPTYHPAFLLRQMSERNKNAVKYDLDLVKKKLKSESN